MSDSVGAEELQRQQNWARSWSRMGALFEEKWAQEVMAQKAQSHLGSVWTVVRQQGVNHAYVTPLSGTRKGVNARLCSTI